MRGAILSICGFLHMADPGQAADCNSAAAAAAAQYGGTVVAVRPVQQGGATVCEIKIKIPGSGGQPPRVETVRVPG